jgi:peptide/nickel transport system ATP-binding protein
MKSDLLRIDELTVDGWAPPGRWARVVEGVSVSVGTGEVVALIGESGAGKTTVALAALGYTRPGMRRRSGRVLFGGEDLTALPAPALRALRGRRIAYVAQSAAAALNPARRVGDQVAEGLVVHGLTRLAPPRERVLELLRRLDLPDPERLVHRYPHQLSGGQQQRMMLAMAMACAPALLVLDEPTTALDVTTQIEVLRALREAVRSTGTAAIYVSHDLALVAQMADAVVVMYRGRVVDRGPTGPLLTGTTAPYTKLLVAAVRPAPRRAPPPVRPAGPASDRPVLLSAAGLWAAYGRGRPFGRPAPAVLRGVSCTVAAGETLALVGESGSGKSTLARVVAGLHLPSAGTVSLRGVPLAAAARRRTPDQLREIQIVFQSPDLALNPAQRVGEILDRPIRFYFDRDAAARRRRVGELLERVGLEPADAGRRPSELSGGERQRVSLARAFAAEPSVVLCDEVLSSLDTVVASTILELLKELQRASGAGYLFVSHDLATVASIADRVAVIYAGTICEEGPAARVFGTPAHPYTAALLDAVPELRPGWLDEVAAAPPPGRPGERAPGLDGCPFFARCGIRLPGTCDRVPPPVVTIASGHTARCHRTTP